MKVENLLPRAVYHLTLHVMISLEGIFSWVLDRFTPSDIFQSKVLIITTILLISNQTQSLRLFFANFLNRSIIEESEKRLVLSAPY